MLILFFLQLLEGAIGNVKDWPGVIPCLVLAAAAAIPPLFARSLVRVGYLAGALAGIAILTLRVFLLPPAPYWTELTSVLAPPIALAIGLSWRRRPWWGNARVVSGGILVAGGATLGLGWALTPAPEPAPSRQALFDVPPPSLFDIEPYALRFDSLKPVPVVCLSEGAGITDSQADRAAAVDCRHRGTCMHWADATRCVEGPYERRDPSESDPHPRDCVSPEVLKAPDGAAYVAYWPGEAARLITADDPRGIRAPLRVLGLHPPPVWLQFALCGWLVGLGLIGAAEISHRRNRGNRANERPPRAGPYRDPREAESHHAPGAGSSLLRNRAAMVILVTGVPALLTLFLRGLALIFPI